MKKFSKIIVCVLALCALCAALVIVGSASNAAASDKTWVVSGVDGEDGLGGFDSFESAANAADGKKAVKLNKDIEVSSELVITRDVHLDLNGHTITETRTTDANAAIFAIPNNANGTVFEIFGEGKLLNCSHPLKFSGNAQNIELIISGYGEGIYMTMNACSDSDGFVFINLENKCKIITITGDVAVTPHARTPKNYNYIFEFGKNGNAKDRSEATELVFDAARFTVNEPADASEKDKSYGAIYLARLCDNSAVTIKNNSFVNVRFGNGFDVSATNVNANSTWSTDADTLGKVLSVDGGFNPSTEIKSVWIDIDDSKFYTFQNGWCTAYNYPGAGMLISVSQSRTLVTVDNSELGGACRTIGAYGNYTSAAGNGTVVGSQFFFNNVDYVYDTKSAYTSSWIMTGAVNMIWNGGHIQNPTNLAGDSYAYSDLGDGVWFGILFKNVCFDRDYYKYNNGVNANMNGSNRVNAVGYAGSHYNNVTFLKNGEITTYNCAFLDEAPAALPIVGNRTSTLDDGVGGGYTAGTKNGTVKYNTVNSNIFELSINSGKYEETRNGYVKLSVDSSTEKNANHYLGLWYFSADPDPAHKGENGAFVVSEFDLATDTGSFAVGTWGLQSRFEKHEWKLNDAGTAIEDGGQLINPSNNNGFRLSNNNYIAFYMNADGTLDLSNKYTTYAKDASGKDITSIKLKTDGTWARVTIVYEFIAELVDYKPVEGSDLTKKAYDFSKSKAHLYIDGVWAATKVGIFTNEMQAWQLGNKKVNAMVDVEQADTFNIDSLRFQYLNNHPTGGTASTCIDNVRVSYYSASEAAKNESLAAVSGGAADISGYDELLMMPTNSPIGGTAIGTVDGKAYFTEAQLAAAIKDGSYVELAKDFESVLSLGGKRVAIKLNGHSFMGISSATNKVLIYGDIVNSAHARDNEIVDVVLKDEGFGVDAAVKAGLGTVPEYNGISAGTRVASNGAFRTFVAWKNANGGVTVEEALVEGGKIAFVAEVTSESYNYEISINGTTQYYTDLDIITNINKAQEGNTVVAIIWRDFCIETNSAIIVPKNGALYFDVNGHEFMLARSKDKTSAVGARVNSDFYLYSSREGGSFINAAGYYNGVNARTLGGVVWYADGLNGTNIPPRATFGKVKNEALGIDADGANLTVMGSGLVDVYGTYLNKVNESFTDKDGDGIADYAGYARVNVDGGNYVRLTNDAMGLFVARAQLEVNIKNANLFGEGSIFGTDQRFYEPVMKVKVEGSKIMTMSNGMEAIATRGAIFGAFYKGSHAEISDSTVCGGWNYGGSTFDFVAANANFGGHDKNFSDARNEDARRGTVTIGSDVELTTVPTNKCVSYGEGLVVANAKYNVTNKISVPTLEYVYTTADGTVKVTLLESKSGTVKLLSAITAAKLVAHAIEARSAEMPVAAYVAAPEGLAKLVWYDSDNETVLKEAYNAPKGEVVADATIAVTPIYGNEWYDLTFTRWNVPELTAGVIEIYPICDTPTASVKGLKVNLTVYTYFRLNFYLPANTEERVVLQGIFEDANGAEPIAAERVVIDGVEYLAYSVYPGAANAEEKTRYIIYTVDGERFVQAFDYGVPTYAEHVLTSEEGEFEEAHLRLVTNMVRYANACYTLVNGSSCAKYDDLLANHAVGLIDYDDVVFSAEEINVDYSKIGKYISSASFLFGSYQPRFAFRYNDLAVASAKLPKDATGDIGAWPRGNKGVFSHIYYNDYENFSSDHLADHVVFDASGRDVTESYVGASNFNGADSVWAMSNNVFVYDMTEVMGIVIYAPDGTVVRGTYSLAAYINAIDRTADPAAYDAAMALYAYSLVAQEFVPEGVIGG